MIIILATPRKLKARNRTRIVFGNRDNQIKAHFDEHEYNILKERFTCDENTQAWSDSWDRNG